MNMLANTFVDFHKTRRTSAEQLRDMYDRISERMQNRDREIGDLHELLNDEHEKDVESIHNSIFMLNGWNAEDEDRLEAIDELLRR